MKYNKTTKVLAALVLSVVMLCGCSADTERSGTSGVVVVDAGGVSADGSSVGGSSLSSAGSGALDSSASSGGYDDSGTENGGSDNSDNSGSDSSGGSDNSGFDSSSEPPQSGSAAPNTPDSEPAPETPASSTAPATTTTPKVTTTTPAATTPKVTTTPATTTTPKATTTTPSTTTTKPPSQGDPQIGSNGYKAVNYAEAKGAWISYIELNSMLCGKSAQQFRANIGAAYDNCVSLGLNTVYVHVRSHGDAYYKSDYYPWSKYVTGTLGKAPDFDPLQIMVEEAHKRGLSFQAWINPLRACSVSDISGENGYPIYSWVNSAGTKDKYVVAVNGYYYLNPAYSDVLALIAGGAREIAAHYDVDGLHIDDYFYPTTETWFDSAAFASSGYSSLAAFRVSCCDKLVSGLYSAVKAGNKSAIFGVSCQGNMYNNLNLLYADVDKWCANKGYLDYVMPQIYFGFKNSGQPYSTCLASWNAVAASGKVPLIVGLSPAKVGTEDTWAGSGKTEWITDSNILARQLTEARAQTQYGGVCLYSYKDVFTPQSAVKAQMEREIAAFKSVLNS